MTNRTIPQEPSHCGPKRGKARSPKLDSRLPLSLPTKLLLMTRIFKTAGLGSANPQALNETWGLAARWLLRCQAEVDGNGFRNHLVHRRVHRKLRQCLDVCRAFYFHVDTNALVAAF